MLKRTGLLARKTVASTWVDLAIIFLSGLLPLRWFRGFPYRWSGFTVIIDWISARITSRQFRETLDLLGLASIEEAVLSFALPEAAARQYSIKARPDSESERVMRLSRARSGRSRSSRSADRSSGSLTSTHGTCGAR
jgi:hypothetical protein